MIHPDNIPRLPWYADYANLVILTRWLADSGEATASDIAYAVEKPWKYEAEFKLAKSAESGGAS